MSLNGNAHSVFSVVGFGRKKVIFIGLNSNFIFTHLYRFGLHLVDWIVLRVPGDTLAQQMRKVLAGTRQSTIFQSPIWQNSLILFVLPCPHFLLDSFRYLQQRSWQNSRRIFLDYLTARQSSFLLGTIQHSLVLKDFQFLAQHIKRNKHLDTVFVIFEST